MYRLVLVFLVYSSVIFGGSIQGFWKKLHDETGKPQCIFAIYEYKNVCYGRIIVTYDDEGKLSGTIYKPKERAPGVVGNPYYCGLDMIWDLQNLGSKYKGRILDPQEGEDYKVELWTEGDSLKVRGKLGVFFRTYTWFAATEEDFPQGFKKPSLNSLIPIIPVIN